MSRLVLESVRLIVENYVQELHKTILKNRNDEEAQRISNYSQNQFSYVGLRAPQMRAMFKNHIRNYGIPAKEELSHIIYTSWELEEREMQIIGLYLLDLLKKEFVRGDIALLENIITIKPWWDTIDHIAKNHLGYYFKKFTEDRQRIIDKWIDTNNTWLIRSCLLFQLGYKEKTDIKLLEDIISKTYATNEFFIDKAIGWALREYGKQNPNEVLRLTNKYPLSKLSKREALKHILQ